MQFMVIAKAKSSIEPPSEHLPAIAETGLKQMEYVKDLESKGKVKFAAPFPVEWGGVMILDVGSADEVNSIVLNFPASPWFNWTVEALASWEGIGSNLASYRDSIKEKLSKKK
jgi:muconolactone delta-isomerase